MAKSGVLAEILDQFRDQDGALTARQVAQALGRDPVVVAGMLDTLVQMGRLSALENDKCDLCPLRTACSPSDGSAQCYLLKT